jgi:hypothetical protein
VPPDESSAAFPPTPSRSSNTISGIGSSRRPFQSPLWPGFRTVLQPSTSSSKKKGVYMHAVLHSKSNRGENEKNACMDPGKPNFENRWSNLYFITETTANHPFILAAVKQCIGEDYIVDERRIWNQRK